MFGTRSSGLALTASTTWRKTSPRIRPWKWPTRGWVTTALGRQWWRNSGQQTLRGSLLFRWPATQMKGLLTTTMKEVKSSNGSYRTFSAELHRQQRLTVSQVFRCGLFLRPVRNSQVQQASSHAFTVNNFHNRRVTFNVIQGQCSSPKSSHPLRNKCELFKTA